MKSLTKIDSFKLILLIALIELIALPLREFFLKYNLPLFIYGFLVAAIPITILLVLFNASKIGFRISLDKKEFTIKNLNFLAPALYSGILLGLAFTIDSKIRTDLLFGAVQGFLIIFPSALLCIFIYNILPIKIKINKKPIKKISLATALVVGIFEFFILPFMLQLEKILSNFNSYTAALAVGFIAGILGAAISVFLLNALLKNTKLIKIEI